MDGAMFKPHGHHPNVYGVEPCIKHILSFPDHNCCSQIDLLVETGFIIKGHYKSKCTLTHTVLGQYTSFLKEISTFIQQ